MTAVLRLNEEQAAVLEALNEGRDPEIFASKVLGVSLNPAQRRWFRLVRPHENGWEWRLKAVLHVAANQIGKTLGLAVLIIWAAWYKIGISTDDNKLWMQAPYQWFHLAPTQQQAYIPLKDMVLLLQGAHPAQPPEGLHQKVLQLVRPQVQQVKIEQYYDGLSFWNGAIVQFRTTEDKAKALQGRRASGISYDEAAFEDHLRSVVNETLLMRLISTGGPLWMVSTPNGINDWFEIVNQVQETALPRRMAQEGDPEIGGSCQVGDLIPMWENDDGWSLVWSTVLDNIGFGISQKEADRMERDLDPATKEQQLRGAFLEPAEAYFVPSAQIDRAFRNIPEEELPQPGHVYIISWDPSATTDPTVCIVIDVTKKQWRGVYMRRWEKPLGEVALLTEMYMVHALYNGGSTPRNPVMRPPRALTTWDQTSMGGALIGQALATLSPKRPLNLAGPTAKKNGLSTLRAALNTGRLIFPKTGAWMRLRREILTYKLPDEKIVQDCVMCALGAADAAAKGFSGDVRSKFQPTGRTGRGYR